MNVTVRPELLRWARNRASLTVAELAPKVGTKARPAPLQAWEDSEVPVEIPVKQLEKFAEKTRAPFGMLFLSNVPDEPIPIRDFRHSGTGDVVPPSLNLLETIYKNQLRQAWLSEVFQDEDDEPLDFIGSVTINAIVDEVAAAIRNRLRIATADRQSSRRTADAVLWMIARLEESRITVIRKGFAGTNTRNALNPEEFKGFALADKFAPFIFINGKDYPGSQMFTIAHECAHLWLGESALPDGDWFSVNADPMERFCNQVAAEVLIPSSELQAFWTPTRSATENARIAAEHFKVSSLATLFRAGNTNLISQETLNRALRQIDANFESRDTESANAGGGNFYNNAGIHLGKRFVREVLTRTLEGRTLYSEAFELLGTRHTDVIHKLAARFL